MTAKALEIIILILMLIYSAYKKWYLPVGYSSTALIGIILAYYFEKNNKKDKIASFNEKGIKIPGLGRHSNAPWSEIKNIILKNNILTIDFRNNKLYQAQLSKNNSLLDHNEFIQFAKDKISKNEKNYREDW